jgi:uncharacterized membrane protein
MQHILKYTLALILVIGVRMIPHVPNVEPITATLMPFARKWGMWSGALFGVLAVLLYDLATGTMGPWSFFTAGAYALLGIVAGLYFKRVQGKGVMSYVGFSIIGTLFYDAITGLTVGPLFFGQPFIVAVIGQIPFTLSHVAGNIVLALVVAPLIYKFIVTNEKLQLNFIKQKIAAQ